MTLSCLKCLEIDVTKETDFMSIFLPYNPTDAVNYFSTLFNLNLTSLTDFQLLIITLFANIYFFVFWFIIIYFSLKIFNRIWERFF